MADRDQWVGPSPRSPAMLGSGDSRDLKKRITVLERPSGHRRLVRQAAACAALVLAAFIVGLSAVPAVAVTCSGGATMTIDVAGGESVALSLSGEAVPLAIVVTPSGPGCGAFVTSTVKAIRVNGTAGDEGVTIDQSGSAPFPHQDTTSIDLALGDGTDALVIIGQNTADSIGFGPDGIGLDAGGTPDVTGIGTVERFTVDAGGGDDAVSGMGGGGLGGPIPTRSRDARADTPEGCPISSWGYSPGSGPGRIRTAFVISRSWPYEGRFTTLPFTTISDEPPPSRFSASTAPRSLMIVRSWPLVASLDQRG